MNVIKGRREAWITTNDIERLRKQLKVGSTIMLIDKIEEEGSLSRRRIRKAVVVRKYRHLVEIDNKSHGIPRQTVTYGEILMMRLGRRRERSGDGK